MLNFAKRNKQVGLQEGKSPLRTKSKTTEVARESKQASAGWKQLSFFSTPNCHQTPDSTRLTQSSPCAGLHSHIIALPSNIHDGDSVGHLGNVCVCVCFENLMDTWNESRRVRAGSPLLPVRMLSSANETQALTGRDATGILILSTRCNEGNTCQFQNIGVQ